MIRVLILVVLCLFLLTLSFSNSHSLVSLNYFFGVTSRPVPVAWLISGAFAAGLLLGWLFMLPGWVRLKLELRRQKRTQDRLEEEISLQRKPTGTRGFNIPTSSPTSSDLDEF